MGYCDTVLFIALFNRKTGETWKYIPSAQLKMMSVYKRISVSAVFMKAVMICLSDQYADNLHIVS